VNRPLGVVGYALGERVHTDAAAAGIVGRVKDELHPYRALGREGQRRLDGQLVEYLAPDPLAREQSQFHEPGTGQERYSVHRVIGQPWVGVHGQSRREQEAARRGQRYRRTEHRVLRRRQAEPGRVQLAGDGCVEPEPFALERVGG
jgi:hypothetical protein